MFGNKRYVTEEQVAERLQPLEDRMAQLEKVIESQALVLEELRAALEEWKGRAEALSGAPLSDAPASTDVAASAAAFATPSATKANAAGSQRHAPSTWFFSMPTAEGVFPESTPQEEVGKSIYQMRTEDGGFRIFGSSPETHCRIEDNDMAYIDPIAGTTRRTGDPEQDAKNALYLRNDPKENAEHVMLVDLARNDLSRNCEGVKVDFYKDMQYYSHVIHLVSRVSGTLAEGKDPVKAFIDTFPAGTLSGAPKVRAMQLISQIEPHNRGAYGGCVGSIGFDGSLNQAITIRT